MKKKKMSWWPIGIGIIFLLIVLIFFLKFRDCYIGLIKPSSRIDIATVMSWPMKHVVERYQRDYMVASVAAQEFERELKRYLILSAYYYPESIDMHSRDIDNLWHTFLLFTKDYKKFCTQLLGHFIHHEPKVQPLSMPLIEKLDVQQQYEKNYEAFAQKYVMVFNEMPSEAIWQKKSSGQCCSNDPAIRCCSGGNHDDDEH